MAVRRALMAAAPRGEWIAGQNTELSESTPEETVAVAADTSAKREKGAKRKRAKRKSAGKEKREKPVVAVSGESTALQEDEPVESKRKKQGKKAAQKKIKKDKTGKHKRVKDKSAAKEKSEKRKSAKGRKRASKEVPMEQAGVGVGKAGKQVDLAESKPKKPGGKVVQTKAKEEKRAKPTAALEEEDGKSGDTEKEKITVKKAVLVEPIQDESAHAGEAAQPAAPVIPPPIAGQASTFPSRFWPKVALGTIAVIVGFSYIRHLGKDQPVQGPGDFVGADSRSTVTAAGEAEADKASAGRRPAAPLSDDGIPGTADRTNAHPTRSPELGVAASLSQEVATAGRAEEASDASGSRVASVLHMETSPEQRATPGFVSENHVAQPMRRSPPPSYTGRVPRPADSPIQDMGTEAMTGRMPSAQYRFAQPGAGAPVETSRWQRPRLYQPYQPYRSQYGGAYPAYPVYVCPVEPQLRWYTNPAGRRGDWEGN